MKNKTKQRGAAIILALFVVALVAMIATVMLERLRTDIRRTELILNANVANLYAQGSLLWAIDQLNANGKAEQPNKLVDRTPIKSPVSEQQGYVIYSVIYDAQGLFNLNNLTDPKNQAGFVQLIQAVSPETRVEQAKQIALGVSDWVANATNPAFDEFYLKSTPSYRAPHHLMASMSELSLVKDMTPDLFTKLLPFIIALPQTTFINVNNAPAPVLMSLSQTLSMDSAKTIEATAKKTPFATLQDFSNFPVVKNNALDINKITVKSNYFLVETNVTLGQQHLQLYTLLERTGQGAQTNTIVLWQSKGTL